jgi:ferrous iron transport protein A
MITLRDIAPDRTVTTIKVLGSGKLRKRLLDMGLTKGTEIYVKKVAPLGDPIEISLRGYDLSLRKDEAAFIQVIELR